MASPSKKAGKCLSFIFERACYSFVERFDSFCASCNTNVILLSTIHPLHV